MGTNCALLVAVLFLFCNESDCITSLSVDKQADIKETLNTTSRYLDDNLNIDNIYFDNMVSQIYHLELQLYKANTSVTEASFLDLHLSVSNDIISTKIYDKQDDFLIWKLLFPIFRWCCSSLNIIWSLYFSTHLIFAMLQTSTLVINF